MFKVDVSTWDAYFNFDPLRKPDLMAFDAAMEQGVSHLRRYFHAGTPKGQPGMRFKMIGYGPTRAANGVEWPQVGAALQKNYISIYMQQSAILDRYAPHLGALRVGIGNFSFVRFADLNRTALIKMLAEM